MQTKTNRRGLAIGAAIALIGSFFGAAPASYAVTDGQYISIRPLSNSDLTNFGGLISEDFPIYAQLKSGDSNANANFANGKVLWQIQRTAGTANIFAAANAGSGTTPGGVTTGLGDLTTYASSSARVAEDSFGITDAGLNTTYSPVAVTTDSRVVTLSASVSPTGVAPLFLRALASTSGTTTHASTSPNVTFTVTIFIDDLGGVQNGRYDNGEWFTTQAITLYSTANLVPTVTVGTPARGDVWVTASATLTTVNWTNLDGAAFLMVDSSDTTAVFSPNSSAPFYSSVSPSISKVTAAARGGVFSHSFAVSSLTESTTISAGLKYIRTTIVTQSAGVLLGSASTSAVVSSPGVTSISISGVASADLVGGAQTYQMRANKTYTFKVFAATNSVSVSKSVTVILGGTDLVTSSRFISINGAASVANYPANGFTVNTGADGFGTFTVGTTGFVPGNTLTINAEVGNVDAATVTITAATLSYTVTSDFGSLVSTTPGTAVSIPFTVEDQWEEPLTAASHFLKVTRGTATGTAFNYATTVSYVAIANGAAVVSFTPEPATRTGSARVTVEPVRLDNTAYISAGSSINVDVTVTTSALAFSTGLAASRAASVSYFASTVSWVAVSGKAVVPGSAIVVTGDTLVFRASSAVPATTSGTITVYANSSGNYSFDVAALRSGTKTMTLRTGTATTTSELVVADAASDQGRTIAWDTTTIEAGKTRVITGTLTDANGNPVDTTGVGRTVGDSAGSASIVVTYTGTAGILVGTMPTETDANGQFKVSVLTAAADSGTLTITAVYMPQGASTVAANKITSVQAVTVAPAAAAEVNAVIGSFNGRWAVRVENAKGSVVSVKAGNRWVKFTSLNNNYLYSRKSVKGRTIAVSVWVDGELQNSQTITIK